MKSYKYSIELTLKKDCNLELASVQFTRALELPKKLFSDNLYFLTLRYQENEKEFAIKHCEELNKQAELYGYNEVLFEIREH